MNSVTKTIEPGNRKAILDEINYLLQASGTIDEARAKRVRKAADLLNREDAPTAADDENNAVAVEIEAALDTLRARIQKQVERRNRDYEKAQQLMRKLIAAD